MIDIVLASGSEARARLLKAAGLKFEVVKPLVDEAEFKQLLLHDKATPADGATALAEIKIEHVHKRRQDDAVIIGGDQLLVMDGRWFDKPESRGDAKTQLKALRGKHHQLFSAAVAWRGGKRIGHHVDIADLWMRDFSDDFLDHYLGLAGSAATDSVGSYHIEGMGLQLMQKVEGDWFTIQGMPLLPILQWLRDQGALRQ